MYRSWNQQQRQTVSYTCMLWSAGKDEPVVVTVHDERDDRWLGRRVVGTLTSFESPCETFMKSEWRRDENASVPQPVDLAPPVAALDARARYLKAFKGTTP